MTSGAVLRFDSEAETSRFARALAPLLRPGDVLLLEGDLGAGKTHFARAVIQSRLSSAGRLEDVPSPTFTLVQTYDDGAADIWHCDLYRLHDAGEAAELGLGDAFVAAICLVEWPDRLGPDRPDNALTLRFGMDPDPDARTLHVSAPGPRWSGVLSEVLARSDHG